MTNIWKNSESSDRKFEEVQQILRELTESLRPVSARTTSLATRLDKHRHFARDIVEDTTAASSSQGPTSAVTEHDTDRKVPSRIAVRRIHMPEIPDLSVKRAADYRQWRDELNDAVAGASNNPTYAFQWMTRVAETADIRDLQHNDGPDAAALDGALHNVLNCPAILARSERTAIQKATQAMRNDLQKRKIWTASHDHRAHDVMDQ